MHNESTKPSSQKRSAREVTCTVCGKQFRTTVYLRDTCSAACRKKLWRDMLFADAPSAQMEPIRTDKGAANSSRHRRVAPKPASPPLVAPEDDWTEEEAWLYRAQYWEAQQPVPSLPKDLQRSPRPDRTPMVLNGHGAYLKIHRGALIVRNGFTHYPQQNPELRFFPGDAKLPSRIIALDCDGSISLDVVRWLSEQGVPLILLSWQGEVVSVMGQHTAYNPALRQAQVEALTNGRGVTLARELIRMKVEGCKETLTTFPRTPARQTALRKLDCALTELDWPHEAIEDIRMIEARAALAYFTHWQELHLHWKGVGRKPIPSEWYRIGLRKGLIGATNRHATHPVNAMLNYAYAALESQVSIATTAAGLDSSVGYLHARHPGRLALVYDLMEPVRPKVDSKVLDFLRSHVFMPSDFVLTPRGVCRLHLDLARHVAQFAVSEEVIDNHVVRTAVAVVSGLGPTLPVP